VTISLFSQEYKEGYYRFDYDQTYSSSGKYPGVFDKITKKTARIGIDVNNSTIDFNREDDTDLMIFDITNLDIPVRGFWIIRTKENFTFILESKKCVVLTYDPSNDSYEVQIFIDTHLIKDIR